MPDVISPAPIIQYINIAGVLLFNFGIFSPLSFNSKIEFSTAPTGATSLAEQTSLSQITSLALGQT